MRICLYCNGMKQTELICPNCGLPLTDGGMVEDYYDPYSPYVAKARLPADEACIHLLYCSGCDFDTREPAPLAKI